MRPEDGTSSSSGPTHPAITRTAADASSSAGMIQIATGAGSDLQLGQPRQPPLANRLATDCPGAAHGSRALERGSGHPQQPLRLWAGLRPLTEDIPLAAQGPKDFPRTQMWRHALAAHDACHIHATEVRASGLSGPELRATWASEWYRDCSPGGASQ